MANKDKQRRRLHKTLKQRRKAAAKRAWRNIFVKAGIIEK